MKTEEIIVFVFAIVVIVALVFKMDRMEEELIETRKQRDEAYELARKAQNSAMYWYDVHEKMVWHTQPNEETK